MRKPSSWDQRDEAHYLRRRMTTAEHTLWQRLRGKGLGMKFFRRRIVCGVIPSFYSIKVRLAVHVVRPDDALPWTTSIRDVLRIAGVTLLVFDEAEVVSSTDACVQQIRGTIAKEMPSESTRARPIRTGYWSQERKRVRLLRESFRSMLSHRYRQPDQQENR